METPKPYIDDDGNRYYNVRQAAQIVGGVCEKTMWNWANEGETKFGFKLQVKREPMKHHRKHARRENPPIHPREYRMLILEADVLALKEILRAGGRIEPGPWSPADRDRLEVLTHYRHRRPKSAAPHP